MDSSNHSKSGVVENTELSNGQQQNASAKALDKLAKALAATSISSPSISNDQKEGEDSNYSNLHQADTYQTFHPFPRLPAELRIQIWTLALPPAKCLYTVSVSIAIPLISNPSISFKIHHPAPTPTPTSTGNPNLPTHPTALLLTTHESRTIYLTQHPSSIPTSSQGKLHFSPSQAIFHITNYTTLQRSAEFASSFKFGGDDLERLRSALEGIRYLATTKDSFYPSAEREAWWGGRGGGPSVRIFSNLETWYCLTGDSGSRAATEEEMRRATGRLESFRMRFNSEWRVPRIEMLQL